MDLLVRQYSILPRGLHGVRHKTMSSARHLGKLDDRQVKSISGCRLNVGRA
jgi:hypothetical protein